MKRLERKRLQEIFKIACVVAVALVFSPLLAATAADEGPLNMVTVAGTSAFNGDGGKATSATLNLPRGLAVDGAGNLYIADRLNNRVRRVDTAGTITTVAGTVTAGFNGDTNPLTGHPLANEAQLNDPTGLALDAAGNLFIVDRMNHRVRRVAAGTGIITTVAGTTQGFFGDGLAATAAQLNMPHGVALDTAGNLYIADATNHRVRRVDAGTGIITTVAGTATAGFNGDTNPLTGHPLANEAQLNSPQAVALDAAGNLYIAERLNNLVRKVAAGTGIITTVAGTGTQGFSGDGVVLATSTKLNAPQGVAIDPAGNLLYIADTGNVRVRVVNLSNATVTIAGQTVLSGYIALVAGSGTNGLGNGGPATAAQITGPFGVAVNPAGNLLYIADTSNSQVRMVAAGIITTVAGGCSVPLRDGGPATAANLNTPRGVALDAAGNLYIADTSCALVRMVAAGIITTVAGTGAAGFSGDSVPATSAQLNNPTALALDAAGNLYIADATNHRVRRVDAGTGIITTVAGTVTAGFNGNTNPLTGHPLANEAQLNGPAGVALAAGKLYIADTSNNLVRMVAAGTGIITTVAGTGDAGNSGDGGPAIAAQINPRRVALDAAGNLLYIAQANSVRVVNLSNATVMIAGQAVLAGYITTVAGGGPAGVTGDGGPATMAVFNSLLGIAVDPAGNLYAADENHQSIRFVNLSNAPVRIASQTVPVGYITTVAGTGVAGFSGDDGPATEAQLAGPAGVTLDAAGNVYIGDAGNSRVRRLNVAAKNVSVDFADRVTARVELYDPREASTLSEVTLRTIDPTSRQPTSDSFPPGRYLGPDPADPTNRRKGVFGSFGGQAEAALVGGQAFRFEGRINGRYVSGDALYSITWNNPADITYGTALSATQLNATANFGFGGTPVPGTFTYTPAAGTVLGAGAGQTLVVTFTPTDMTKSPATATVQINVLHVPITPYTSQPISLDSDFNGTAIPGGDTVWFNGIFKLAQQFTALTHVTMYNQTIQIGSGNGAILVSVPDTVITFDPNATSATTVFDGVIWRTTVPTKATAGNDWLGGVGFPVPAGGLPGGIQSVVWNGTFASDAPASLNWQWAAAVYTNFSANLNDLGIKPVDDNKASAYQNSDHAGTPENYKSFVTGGARGGGGSNYTGSYSGTRSVSIR